MLYDADNALSTEDQSSRLAEEVLAREVASLRLAAPNARLPEKHRLLHFMQEKHFRLPHLVVQYGTQLIQNAAGKLGNAVWDMYERVLVAALDAHDYAAATWSLGELEARWPGSARVARLRGMTAEARGYYSTAEEEYVAMLEAEPTNMAAARRQVAVAKAAGQLGHAIALLSKFVRAHASDESAWSELSELYIHTQQYELAAFAVEELLLLQPESYLLHARYAELMATLGQWDTARLYYAQSVELKPNNNLRALYGLQLALQRTGKASGARQTAASVEPPAKLADWSAKQLRAHYAKFQPALAHLAEATLAGEAGLPVPAVAPSSGAAGPAATAAGAAAAAGAEVEAEAVEESERQNDAAEPKESRTPQEAELPD